MKTPLLIFTIKESPKQALASLVQWFFSFVLNTPLSNYTPSEGDMDLHLQNKLQSSSLKDAFCEIYLKLDP